MQSATVRPTAIRNAAAFASERTEKRMSAANASNQERPGGAEGGVTGNCRWETETMENVPAMIERDLGGPTNPGRNSRGSACCTLQLLTQGADASGRTSTQHATG